MPDSLASLLKQIMPLIETHFELMGGAIGGAGMRYIETPAERKRQQEEAAASAAREAKRQSDLKALFQSATVAIDSSARSLARHPELLPPLMRFKSAKCAGVWIDNGVTEILDAAILAAAIRAAETLEWHEANKPQTDPCASAGLERQPAATRGDASIASGLPDGKLPDGEWLLPPVTLSALRKRLGMNSDDKVKTLLNQYELQNYPTTHRQSWTCNTQNMPTVLKNQISGKKLR